MAGRVITRHAIQLTRGLFNIADKSKIFKRQCKRNLRVFTNYM